MSDQDSSRDHAPATGAAQLDRAALGEVELTVERAAVRVGGVAFSLPRPNRHHNILWWLHALGVRSVDLHDQGFVLSNGCFVDRISAAYFANVAGQLRGPLIAPPHLYSEDLWDGGADLPRPEVIAALAHGGPTQPSTTDGDAVPGTQS